MLSSNFPSGVGTNAVPGDNLLRDERDILFRGGTSAGIVKGIVDNDVPSGYCTTFITTDHAATQGAYFQNTKDNFYEILEAGKTYTLSLYMKADSDIKMNIFIGNNRKSFDINSSWKKIVCTNEFTEQHPFIAFYTVDASYPATKTYVSSLKIEKGTVHNPVWTPAPAEQIFHLLDPIPEMHRNIFRGKNLGTVYTDEQKAAIRDGTFHDLWVGDYWTINSHTWRIVDINYWYNKGDKNCTTPHIVVMPDSQLYPHKMNNDNVTTGGYYGSLMYTEGLTQAKTIVNTDFGEGFVLNHRVLLTNKVDSGHASEGNWYDSTVELANEIMIYGCLVFSAMNNGTAVPYIYTTECTQLALFRLVPRFINISRQWYWLRDVVSAPDFARVDGNGATNYGSVSNVAGVRPVVGITGGTVAADEPDSDLEVTGLSTKGGDPL